MDILFEAEVRDVDPVAVVADRVELARLPEPPVAPVAPYTREIVSGVAEHLDEIDEAISAKLAEDWTLERIPAVDRAILRLSVWELLYNDDVPPKTAVVEGVELAAQYSTDVAPPYINAVLDDVLSQRDELKKAVASNEPAAGEEAAHSEEVEG
ncbi:NusB antitermination factor [Corynebacterium epidermidicanis]|uniref:Transcription antitermination protein NusB n=1 Tax=Corynebacterium epidermidicanis TaxID=1050174 RepID=A0A0G3GUP8_9CORY|nr:NusB antitermination factor [Corynebacterium epidermidicanis]